MKLLSVIIVTYNSVQDIFACIDSIYAHLDIPEEELEIIVADNSSQEVFDEMRQSLTKIYGEKLIILKNERNGGYGQGNNFGIKHSTGKYICIANPDIILQTSMFSKVLKTFRTHTELAMIGGKQKGGLNISFWNRPEYDFFLITAPLSVLFNKLNIYSERYFYLSGALLFMDRSKFEEIGGFDENFFLYVEESDITIRFLKRNYKTHFDRELQYRHLVDGRNDTSDRSFQFLMDSTKKYLEKNGWNFQRFLRKKIISYKIMIIVYSVLNNQIKKEDSKLFLRKFEDLYKCK